MFLAISLLVFLVICFCVGYSILWLFGVFKKPKEVNQMGNPYIEYHKGRRLNDKNYEEYINWLDKNDYSLPVDKVLTKEEYEFKEELQRNKI